jgi:hypothetical protein
VLDNLRDALSVILCGIFDLTTDLSGCTALPNHRHRGGRQAPVWSSGRHVQPGNVLFLMTCAALLAILPVSVNSPFYVLDVNMPVVTLARVVARRMTIETTRMLEDGNHCEEGFASASVVALDYGVGDRNPVFCSGCYRTKDQSEGGNKQKDGQDFSR